MATLDETENLPVAAPTKQELNDARSRVKWVEDEDLSTLERREPAYAAMLSLFTGGGGQLYNGQIKTGLFLMAFWVFSFAIAIAADGPPIHLMMMGPVTAALAYRRAKQINRYIKARQADELEVARLGTRAALSASASRAAVVEQAAIQAPMAVGAELPAKVVQLPPVAPLPIADATSPAAGLGARLQKLAALRKSAVIDDQEYRERRLDAVAELQGLDRDGIDDVLYDLLPLIDQGYLSREDIELIKRLGGG